ncbi:MULTISPECIES: hypothetical protein [unclassified Bacillus cereus group]|uniref:hypothetical protein n=1 Tax=unclassified Bacillus cereus group TaxID=2750818 RepID=UPI001F565F83|nr:MULTISPECIES: hypothetical protein [unclassified Bacillus cereus group]
MRKKWKDCGEKCELIQKRVRNRIASYPRVKDKSYDIDDLHATHESLEVLEGIDENYGVLLYLIKEEEERKVAKLKYISYIDVISMSTRN